MPDPQSHEATPVRAYIVRGVDIDPAQLPGEVLEVHPGYMEIAKCAQASRAVYDYVCGDTSLRDEVMAFLPHN